MHPIKDALIAAYRVNRNNIITRMILFAVWASSFLASQLALCDIHKAWEQQQSVLHDVLIDEEFENSTYKKNFMEIFTLEETWTWLEGPLISAMFSDAWYNDVPYDDGERMHVSDSLDIIGPIRIRQHRVLEQSCSARTKGAFKKFKRRDDKCFREFEIAKSAFEERVLRKKTATPGEGRVLLPAGHCQISGQHTVQYHGTSRFCIPM